MVEISFLGNSNMETSSLGLIYIHLFNDNVRTGGPDLGGLFTVPPPAQHVLARSQGRRDLNCGVDFNLTTTYRTIYLPAVCPQSGDHTDPTSPSTCTCCSPPWSHSSGSPCTSEGNSDPSVLCRSCGWGSWPTWTQLEGSPASRRSH